MANRPAPVVGVTTYGSVESPAPSQWYPKHFIVPTGYVEAIRRADGTPILLPPGTGDVSRWAEICDAVIFTGGEDVDPRYYGGDDANPHVESSDSDRNSTEMQFAKMLLADGTLPLLFICRGMQILNVALGGTLHEHLADLAYDEHRVKMGEWVRHPVTISSESRLGTAMGTDKVVPFASHHQGIKKLADGLTPVAWTADGLVEGVEVPTTRWTVGVQWHPEVNAADDKSQQGLFDALVATARDR